MCFSFGLNVFSVLGWAPCFATFSPDPAEAMNVGFLFFSSLGNDAQYYRLGCLISQARVNPAPTSNRKTYPSVFPGLCMKNTILIGSTSLGWVAIANPRLSRL
jgi:hypothetical protein